MESHVELDNTGKPLVCIYDKIADKALIFVMIGFFYFLFVDMGFFTYRVIEKIWLFNVISYLFSFLLNLIVVGVLWMCSVFADSHDIVTKVSINNHYSDIRIIVAIVTLIVPLSRFVTRSLNKIFVSFKTRRFACIIFIIAIFIITQLFSIFVTGRDVEDFYSDGDLLYNKEALNNAAYYIYAILGIIFFLLYIHIEKKESQMKKRNTAFDQYVKNENPPYVSQDILDKMKV